MSMGKRRSSTTASYHVRGLSSAATLRVVNLCVPQKIGEGAQITQKKA